MNYLTIAMKPASTAKIKTLAGMTLKEYKWILVEVWGNRSLAKVGVGRLVIEVGGNSKCLQHAGR